MKQILNEMLNHTKSRLSGVVRTFGTSPKICASHYDVLGITPKATQADIKSAYYKLSKLYHPDKSSDEESAKKFRAITEAYEVLGNLKLKKMYDKGLLVGKENVSRMGGEYKAEAEPVDPALRFYKSRSKRHIIPNFDGRTPIYDFDEWAKHHYGELVKKHKYDRDFVQHKKNKQIIEEDSSKQELIIYVAALICLGFVFLVGLGKSEYDFDTTEEQSNKQVHTEFNIDSKTSTNS